MKFDIIAADPPWGDWSDKLTMSDVKRGAASQYSGVLSLEDIKNLDINSIAQPNSLLALWVPSSMLQDGLDTMKAWDYDQKQTWIWVKTKKKPLDALIKFLKKNLLQLTKDQVIFEIENFNLNAILRCNMGHLFRQTHEIVLLGIRGKMYDKVTDKSLRSVYLWPQGKHSEKPDGLQEQLDKMFSDKRLKKLEMFARREYPGWVCVGNELEATKGEDIRDSIKRLSKHEDAVIKSVA